MHLSKTRFVTGVQCLKRLYLQVHRPDLAANPDEGALARMVQGQLVGAEARKAFPGGVLVDANHAELDNAITTTRELVANPDVPAIFEATFEADSVLVRVDVLKRDGDKAFQILEVKSSTKLKDEYRYDIGIQKRVVSRAGLNVSTACLMHLNSEYVYAGGDYDYSKLFRIEELTPEIAIDEGEIEALALEQWHVLAEPEPPNIEAGAQCKKPQMCEFFDQCNAPVSQYHVSTLPHISAKKLDQLAAMNIESIHGVADDFPLTEGQRIVRDAVRAGRLWVNQGLATALDEFKYPLCFMDFETINPVLPRFVGMRPYAQIPFQWSVHRLESPGAGLQHFEFLADDGRDPRRPFIEPLIEAVGNAGTILVYNESFEKARLREIAGFMPEYATAIEEIRNRVLDLLPCVRLNVYDPAFGGSYSLKAVLPALLPEMTYEGMTVANGTDAGIAFAKMIDPSISRDEHAHLREALLRYCEQDTLALMRILERMYSFANSPGLVMIAESVPGDGTDGQAESQR
jgi:predicted RecB family nuclease